MVKLLRERKRDLPIEKQRQELDTQIWALLEEGYELTEHASEIAHELYGERQAFYGESWGRDIVKHALHRDPSNSRIRDLWIRICMTDENLQEAQSTAIEGLRLDPANWRFSRHMARILDYSNASSDAVKGHYASALRFNSGDVRLRAEAAYYYVRVGLITEANEIFQQTRSMTTIPAHERNGIRHYIETPDGRKKCVKGKITELSSGAGIAIAIPENYSCRFWQNNTTLANLRRNDQISFHVGVSATGIHAVNISVD